MKVLIIDFALLGFLLIRFAKGVNLRKEDERELLFGGSESEFEKNHCQQDNNAVPTAGQLKVMTYNLWLIKCLTGKVMPCQKESERSERVDEISKWVKTRYEDVIILQEVFSSYEKIRDAMIDASYCHYVTTTKGTTHSGLAIYSKYPIEEYYFEKWPRSTNPENFFDSKGFLYVRIKKGEENVHIINMHTTSTSISFDDGGQSDRDNQFKLVRKFIDNKYIENEMMLIGGDLNQDKFAGDEDYGNMLDYLHAEAFQTSGNEYTYDTVNNPLTRSKYDNGEVHQELLDYILYDKSRLTPEKDSSCEILIPTSTLTSDTNNKKSMLSDHLPVTCSISYPLATTPPHNQPMFFAEVMVYRASVCDADYVGGDSDPYVEVEISKNGLEQLCGKTKMIDGTNEPVWDQMISCNKVQFQASDEILISFDAFDDDDWGNGGPDFIGHGSVAVNPTGEDFDGKVELTNGNCNRRGEKGNLQYKIHLKQVS